MSDIPSSTETFLAPRRPLLTPEQIDALALPDYGVTQPEGIPRFPTFEEWMHSGGLRNKDNFCFNFSSELMASSIRQIEHFERFEIVHKNQFEVLQREADELRKRPRYLEDEIPDQVEYLFWDAYEKLASLVDKDDMHVKNIEDFANTYDAQRYLTR